MLDGCSCRRAPRRGPGARASSLILVLAKRTPARQTLEPWLCDVHAADVAVRRADVVSPARMDACIAGVHHAVLDGQAVWVRIQFVEDHSFQKPAGGRIVLI